MIKRSIDSIGNNNNNNNNAKIIKSSHTTVNSVSPVRTVVSSHNFMNNNSSKVSFQQQNTVLYSSSNNNNNKNLGTVYGNSGGNKIITNYNNGIVNQNTVQYNNINNNNNNSNSIISRPQNIIYTNENPITINAQNKIQNSNTNNNTNALTFNTRQKVVITGKPVNQQQQQQNLQQQLPPQQISPQQPLYPQQLVQEQPRHNLTLVHQQQQIPIQQHQISIQQQQIPIQQQQPIKKHHQLPQPVDIHHKQQNILQTPKISNTSHTKSISNQSYHQTSTVTNKENQKNNHTFNIPKSPLNTSSVKVSASKSSSRQNINNNSSHGFTSQKKSSNYVNSNHIQSNSPNGSSSGNSNSSSSGSGSSNSNSNSGSGSNSSSIGSNKSNSTSSSSTSASQFEFDFDDELQSSQFSSYYDINTSQNKKSMEEELQYNLEEQSQDPHHSQLLAVPFKQQHQNNQQNDQQPQFKKLRVDPNTVSNSIVDCCTKLFDLPVRAAEIFIRRKITKLYDWQKECLTNENLLNGSNLIYSLPTSGGKTLVAEIILLRTVHLKRKKCLFIFPFVSIVTEKTESLLEFSQELRFSVEAYYGIQGTLPVPPGNGICVCTIEKANIIVNQMIEDKRIGEIGTVVVDEIHMVGDGERGILLEMLISKIMFVTKGEVQVVGMSATIPNIAMMKTWMRGDLYERTFRPVKLDEYISYQENVYAKENNQLINHKKLTKKTNNIMELIEDVIPEHSVLVFCNTIEITVNLAKEIANYFQKHKSVKSEEKEILLRNLNAATFPNADETLKQTIPSGVAFHNSSLTNEEREIIEQGFKDKTLNVLCATSTLSAGVNLPARRVIIRSPKMGFNVITTRLYRQMAGRAGRAGIDDSGQSFLYCNNMEEYNQAKKIVTAELEPVISGLTNNPKQFQKITLECISSGIAPTMKDILIFFGYTFYAACNIPVPQKKLTAEEYLRLELVNTLKDLESSGFIEKQRKFDGFEHHNDVNETKKEEEEEFENIIWNATGLGAATFKSSLSTEQAKIVQKDISKSLSGGIILADELHLCYITTPMFQLPAMKKCWIQFLKIYSSLSESKLKIAKLVGIDYEYIQTKSRNDDMFDNAGMEQAYYNFHARFYVAMALCDLIQESPLSVVSNKYQLARGTLQSLMQSSGSFAWMVVSFCKKLQWWALEVLINSYIRRLDSGVKQDIIPLVEIKGVGQARARALWNAGFTTVKSIAAAEPQQIMQHVKSLYNSEKITIRIINSAKALLERQSEELRKQAQELALN